MLVAKAETRDIPAEIDAIGTVEAYSTVAIRPQITGKIIEVHFEEGKEVKAGDLLFTLDPRQWQAALNQSIANSQRDEAQMVSAQLSFERTSNLFASKIASQQDYDAALAQLQALRASVLADNAAISNAQVSLSYTEIRSPIEGRTGNLMIKAGNVVKAPDDVLLKITRIHPAYVRFSVPEQHLPEIRREFSASALPIKAVVPSETNRPAYGKLSFIDNIVDTNTGTIFLKGIFENTNGVLWPGQFVQVSMTLSNIVHATVIPSQAIQMGQNGQFIFVVSTNETAEARPVRSSINYDGATVIESGVKPGETIVTDGQLRLVPGAKVSVKSPAILGETNGVAAEEPAISQK